MSKRKPDVPEECESADPGFYSSPEAPILNSERVGTIRTTSRLKTLSVLMSMLSVMGVSSYWLGARLGARAASSTVQVESVYCDLIENASTYDDLKEYAEKLLSLNRRQSFALKELRKNRRGLEYEGHNIFEIIRFSVDLLEKRIRILEEMKELLYCALENDLLDDAQKDNLGFAIKFEDSAQSMHMQFIKDLLADIEKEIFSPNPLHRGSNSQDTFEL